MSFGERVKMQREKLNMTQGELAEEVGVSRPMINQVEKGLKSPSVPVGVAIAKALGVSLSYLAE